MRETLEVGGRRIEIEQSGPDGADAVVIFHTGTPSAGVLFEQMIEAGAARGVRHLAYSRPGYAHSDRHAGRSVADCATVSTRALGFFIDLCNRVVTARVVGAYPIYEKRRSGW